MQMERGGFLDEIVLASLRHCSFCTFQLLERNRMLLASWWQEENTMEVLTVQALHRSPHLTFTVALWEGRSLSFMEEETQDVSTLRVPGTVLWVRTAFVLSRFEQDD
jgi:hypothetical protein